MSGTEHKPFRTNIEAAVAYLIGKGIIKRDADVVSALGVSKGTFSAYKSGKTEASSNFVQLFQSKYGIRLEDFSAAAQEGQLPSTISNQNPDDMNNCERAIIENVHLKTRVDDLLRTIQDKDEIIVLQRQLIGGFQGKALSA